MCYVGVFSIDGFLTKNFIPIRVETRGSFVPFLFVICAEDFSALIRRAMADQSLKTLKEVCSISA